MGILFSLDRNSDFLSGKEKGYVPVFLLNYIEKAGSKLMTEPAFLN